jgi:hypothetical protein
MDKFMRMSIFLIVVGMSMFFGLCIRELSYPPNAQPSTLSVAPQSYSSVIFPAHTRNLEIEIALTPTNLNISFLIFTQDEIGAIFSDPASFLSRANEIAENTSVRVGVEEYGLIGILLYNPNDTSVLANYTVKITSVDYKAFAVATGFLIFGVLATLFLTIKQRWIKKNIKNM